MTPLRKTELELMQQMVDEAEAIVMQPDRDLNDFGRLLHQGWKVKRSLTQMISNPHIDEIYEAGLSAGALGGKLLGAGGGGFMLFFVPPERQAAVRQRLANLLCVPFRFSRNGSQVVVNEPEESYDPALTKERFDIYAQRP
jgi:D-glycero-alpha-D-manno-heptose-7-phosphate kinase